jgi:acyl carrier protein
VIDKDDFIRIVRQLRLPMADPDLENAFDQEIAWRSLHLVRLFVAMQKATGRKVSVARLFEERTLSGVYRVFAEGGSGEQPAREVA